MTEKSKSERNVILCSLIAFSLFLLTDRKNYPFLSTLLFLHPFLRAGIKINKAHNLRIGFLKIRHSFSPGC